MEKVKADPVVDAIRGLREENLRLRRENASLREEAVRHHDRADEEQRSWQRVHDAMNLLREDAMQLMERRDAFSVYSKLEKERCTSARLQQMLTRRRQICRDLAQKMAAVREGHREIEAVVEELRQKVTLVEQQRDDVDATAQKTIGELQAKLDRIAEQYRLWHRGELDTMSAIAGIGGELSGYKLPEPGVWERAKAARAAELLARHREMSEQLAQIEAILTDAGIDPNQPYVEMLRAYMDRCDADKNEWRTLESDARGFAMALLSHFGRGGGALSALTQAGRYTQVIAQLSEER
jgi:hypothetical protein